MRMLLSIFGMMILTANFALADLPTNKFLGKAFESDKLLKWKDYKGILCFSEGSYSLRSQPNITAKIIKDFKVRNFTYSSDRQARGASDEKSILKEVQEILDASVFIVSALGWNDEYPGSKFCTPLFNNENDFVEIYVDWELREKGWFNLKQHRAKIEVPNNTYYFPVGEIPAYELRVAWNDSNEIVSQKIVRKLEHGFSRESISPREYQNQIWKTLFVEPRKLSSSELKNGWIWISGSDYIEANSKQIIFFKWVDWQSD